MDRKRTNCSVRKAWRDDENVFVGTSGHSKASAQGASSVKYILKSYSLFMALVFVAVGVVYGANRGPEEFGPRWEPLLWGGRPAVPSESGRTQASLQAGQKIANPAAESASEGSTESAQELNQSGKTRLTDFKDILPLLGAGLELEEVHPPMSVDPSRANDTLEKDVARPPVLGMPVLENIPPLYTNPQLPGEGVWDSSGLPSDRNGDPFMFKTSYRPSEKYPNAIVHMLMFDMRRLNMRLYVGSSEPGASQGTSSIAFGDIPRLVAITNALWKQKHSGQAGTIYSGRLIRDLFPGMATLAIYKDSSVDILEWDPDIPLEFIDHAKQLRHLIVKDGRVVDNVIMAGQTADSEIGLGYLLSESEPMPGYQYWGNWWGQPSSMTTSGPDWFIATRSAFGIRNDGNLVFAVGHHISTKDLAKALVLAGCDRAIHGDANPHNVLGNIYFPDGNGGFLKKERLSPDQKSYTLDRYVGKSYTSDFFAFFRKHE